MRAPSWVTPAGPGSRRPRLLRSDCSRESGPEGVTVSDEPSVSIGVPYVEGGSSPQVLDVYSRSVSPAEDAARPAVVLIHGGGWFRGDKSKERALATMLVDAGYLVFAADYREAPDSVFPASRDDVLAAERWAVASEWAFDRSRLAFFGGSAGGNLVVEAAIATGRPAVSWSGMFDLLGIVEATDDLPATPTTQDLDAMKSADINQTGRNDAFLRWTILNEVGGDRGLLTAASTTRHASPDGGPVFLANSLGEFVPVSDAQAMQAALSAVGVASTLQLIPGTRHAEGYTEAAIGPSLAFLRDALPSARA
ncbi:alpha/beta hydrolase [Rathayibacter sp. AY1C3]|nr:alpha/beta hydrolase [Rathayibacter sp. AY1A4]PPG82018.1 alpha/beta hydrolase [Rathayibacter sp. AY1E5]PPH29478.1 alpha/beta hydrolase [Rathayibacter sp. AY1C3]PPH59129.1 alpha/beta hydrolase [Rathayibacter sp. AY1D7]PPI28672.1 alpha/beta hydrolase [Rathayibacter sp. AY1B4]